MTTNLIVSGTLKSASYIAGDDSVGATQTFTNYTHDSGGTAMVTNVWSFKNGLFITNTITQ